MPGVHRNNDLRQCGATTVVTGQSTVFANGELIAVDGDLNTHGEGALRAGSNNVFINGVAVVNHTPDQAFPDAIHPEPDTWTAQGSSDVIVSD